MTVPHTYYIAKSNAREDYAKHLSVEWAILTRTGCLEDPYSNYETPVTVQRTFLLMRRLRQMEDDELAILARMPHTEWVYSKAHIARFYVTGYDHTLKELVIVVALINLLRWGLPTSK